MKLWKVLLVIAVLGICLAPLLFAAEKPLTPGVYRVTACPPAPPVPPPSREECTTLFPPPPITEAQCREMFPCADCPASVAVQPGLGVVQPVYPPLADRADARLVPVAAPADPKARWKRVAVYVGAGLLLRHVVLALDDHNARRSVITDGGGHDCD